MEADPNIGLIFLTLVPAPFLVPFVVIGASYVFGIG
jgi:hypothetical protein